VALDLDVRVQEDVLCLLLFISLTNDEQDKILEVLETGENN